MAVNGKKPSTWHIRIKNWTNTTASEVTTYGLWRNRNVYIIIIIIIIIIITEPEHSLLDYSEDTEGIVRRNMIN